MEQVIDIVLIILLAATLFHAVRLERALGVLKRDRATLEALAANFNDSTRQAEESIARLHDTADGTGRQIVHHADAARMLKEDLVLLVERGERLADRMDSLVRTGRHLVSGPAPAVAKELKVEAPRMRSQAERDLLNALRIGR